MLCIIKKVLSFFLSFVHRKRSYCYIKLSIYFVFFAQETYCYMLTRYGQELARPIQEAEEFFRGIEEQIDSLALGAYTRTICQLIIGFSLFRSE